MSKNAEEIIKSHAELFPPLQVKLALKLCSNECDQGHLLSDWDSTSRGDDEKKKKMMHQLELLEKTTNPEVFASTSKTRRNS